MTTANSYELAARAMALTDSIQCGPNGRSCDGGEPAYVCPNHGGDHSDRDDWTGEDEAAYEEYQRRWKAEVMR